VWEEAVASDALNLRLAAAPNDNPIGPGHSLLTGPPDLL
jgi:hypothetical protein